MGKNAYLARKRAENQRLLDIGEELGFQKCWDYLQIALRDPAVVGAGNEWGHERIKRLYHGIDRAAQQFADAFTAAPEADWLQEKLDRKLEEIWAEELQPFRERYPYIQQFRYDKARKEWK